jgi:proline racemase
MNRVQVIDSHTEGEPTRIVISGGPDLGTGSMRERLDRFRAEHDRFRSAIVNEPRGSDVLVGALLCPSEEPDCTAGVIFFNNVGYLGMCGHGLLGLIATLAHLERIKPGTHRIETPVGTVRAEWHQSGEISVQNVASFRMLKDLEVRVPGLGVIRGDIAWGGNWFFLTNEFGIALTRENAPELTAATLKIRSAVNLAGYPEVDHIELSGLPLTGGNSRNFVLCPGGAFDRSPCGTGTSAKLACLAADGLLQEGEHWIQESILGTRFSGRFAWDDRADGIITPSITGCAFVTGESTLLLDEKDPLCWGIR